MLRRRSRSWSSGTDAAVPRFSPLFPIGRSIKIVAIAAGLLLALLPESAPAEKFGVPGYGQPIVIGSLSNLTLVANREVAFRVKFPHPGSLTHVRHFFQGRDGGYGAGNGGTMKFELRADDGTSAHNPSTTVLGSTNAFSAQPARSGAWFPNIAFTSPISVQANTWYHLVVFNTASNANSNYVSSDNAMEGNWERDKARDPVLDGKLLTVSYRQGTGSWNLRESEYAVLDLTFSNGSHWGQGYMEASSTAQGGARGHDISGSNKVRQVFTFPSSAAPMPFVDVQIAVARVSGSGAITATLTGPGVNVSAQNSIPPWEGIYSQISWNQGYVTFPITGTLEPGATYQLTLTGPSNAVYRVFPPSDGNAAGYGFHTSTVLANGYAQYSTNGSTWINWDGWGKPSQNYDIPFWFTPSDVAPPPSPLPPSPPGDAEVIVEEAGAIPGSSVLVQFDTGGHCGVRDWLGVHHLGATGQEHEANWRYLNNSQNPPGSCVTSGEFTMTMPSTPGWYEVRLYFDDAFSPIQTSSGAIKVVHTIAPYAIVSTINPARNSQVHVEVGNGPAIANGTDWIGRYAPSASNDQFQSDWKYLSCTQSPARPAVDTKACTFTIPNSAGIWQLRFFRNDSTRSGDRLATSRNVVVP